ncbi:MAG: M23 family metallopeptidase [Candidatus Riflebacteria bacterium]|nr:M23 family metallopeptidase [Candidatus Riflebacteria bacterium]
MILGDAWLQNLLNRLFGLSAEEAAYSRMRLVGDKSEKYDSRRYRLSHVYNCYSNMVLRVLAIAVIAFCLVIVVMPGEAIGQGLIYSSEDIDPLPPPDTINLDNSFQELINRVLEKNPLLKTFLKIDTKETRKILDTLFELDRKWRLLDGKLKKDIVGIVSKKARLDLEAGLRLTRLVKNGEQLQARLESAVSQYEKLKEISQKDGDLKQEGRYAFFLGKAKELLARSQRESAKKSELIRQARDEYKASYDRLSKAPDTSGSVAADDALEKVQLLDQPFGGIIPLVSPFHRPVQMTSDIGFRMHPIKKKMLFHKGVDFAEKGCDGWHVCAFGPGRVVFSGWEYGYGYAVVVCHEIEGKQIFTRYAHLRKASRVVPGKVVSRGEVIALCNNSGGSTGSHLHFEMRDGDLFGPVLDPKGWLPGRKPASMARTGSESETNAHAPDDDVSGQ